MTLSCTINVLSLQNQAEYVARKMFPSLVLEHNLYWKGPSFLFSTETSWPSNILTPMPMSLLPYFKSSPDNVSVLTSILNNINWLSRFSSLHQMQLVLSYVRRFNHARKFPLIIKTITTNRLDVFLLFVIRVKQRKYFSGVIYALTSKKNLSSKGIACHTLFMDNHYIIRVGDNNQTDHLNIGVQSYCQKNRLLTTLIIRHFHFKFKHAGPQLLASLIADQYWILTSRSVIRLTIFIMCSLQSNFTQTNNGSITIISCTSSSSFLDESYVRKVEEIPLVQSREIWQCLYVW